MTNTDKLKCGAVIAHKVERKTLQEISQATQVPQTTCYRILKKHETTANLERQKGSGRKCVLQDEHLAVLRQLKDENAKASAPRLQKLLEERTGLHVSRQTIARGLNKCGFYAYKPVSKPALSAQNIVKRKSMTNDWICKPDSFWRGVIYSDECKFNLYNSDGNSHVWRRPGEGLESKYVDATVKFNRGNVMVWGCFSSKGVGRLVFIDDKMDSVSYLRILTNNLRQSATELGMDTFIFQQDNDPKHTSTVVRKFFEEEKIEVLPWPSQSPDLNPIEHLWASMKAKMRGNNYKTKNDLKAAITEIWEATPQSLIDNLIASMPRRIESVFRAKGKHSKY